jgi:surface protein
MITYRFVSQTFLGEPIKVQYSKYSSTTRIDLGSGTFPFEYTTDQKGGTYYFYIPKLDTTFTKTIDIPPIDFVVNSMNVPDCDISGIINEIPECDITSVIIEIPVCDVDYNVVIATPTPTPTTSVVCPILTGVTVGPIEISGGEYTLVDNTSSLYLHQFDSSGQYICDISSQSNSILPDSLFQDEITVLVPSPYWFGGPCQYCFNINTSEEVFCNFVIPSQTPTPSVTSTVTPTITPTPSITSTATPTLPIQTPTNTSTPTITPTPTNTLTPTTTNTQTITPTITQTPTNSLTPTNSQTPTPSPTSPPKAFISVWSGSSVTLPYNGIGTYTGTIDWGDGFVSANTFANRTHTYSGSGTWTITITGTITGWATTNAPTENNKLLEIKQWNNVRNVFGQSASFSGCSNLVLTGVTDTYDFNGISNTTSMFANCTSITTINNISSWNLSGITNLGNMFNGCINFNDDITTWDVSNVTSLSNMLYSASSFNQDLGSWDVSNVSGFGDFMAYCGISTLNYDNTLIGWSSLTLGTSRYFGAYGLTYTSAGAGGAARSFIISNYSWSFVGDIGI